MADGLPVDVLVQAGAVGIAIALIILLALLLRSFFNLLQNHIVKTDETMRKNAEAMVSLGGVINANTDAVERHARISERIERYLDNHSG